jgi:hypothetical protein
MFGELPELLGMNRIVSEDTVRRSLSAIDDGPGHAGAAICSRALAPARPTRKTKGLQQCRPLSFAAPYQQCPDILKLLDSTDLPSTTSSFAVVPNAAVLPT